MKSKLILLFLGITILFASCLSLRHKGKALSNKRSCIESDSLRRIVFSDNFDDNKNNWNLISNDNFLVYINNGVLHIEKYKKNRENNGCLWFKKSIDNFNTSTDFKISFDTQFITYDDVYSGIDFQWGNLNDELFQFSFNTHGQMNLKKFTRNISSRWTDITSTVELKLIEKSSTNKVSIRQIDDRCIICINDIEVINTKIQKINGNQIGFQQCLKVAWEMDNLEIRQ